MAKLKAVACCARWPDACLQFWGGMGYTWDKPRVAHVPRRRLASIAAVPTK